MSGESLCKGHQWQTSVKTGWWGESAGRMTRQKAGTMAQTSGAEGTMRTQMRLQITVSVFWTLVGLQGGGRAGGVGWTWRLSPMDSGKGDRLGKGDWVGASGKIRKRHMEAAKSMDQEASRCFINAH